MPCHPAVAEPGPAQVALRQQPVWLGGWGGGAEKSQSSGNRLGKTKVCASSTCKGREILWKCLKPTHKVLS